MAEMIQIARTQVPHRVLFLQSLDLCVTFFGSGVCAPFLPSRGWSPDECADDPFFPLNDERLGATLLFVFASIESTCFR